jgi:hypothetical protein
VLKKVGRALILYMEEYEAGRYAESPQKIVGKGFRGTF